MTQDVLIQDLPSITPHTLSLTPASVKRRKHLSRKGAWQEEPFNHAKGEQALWAAVITQAMMDALSQSRNPEARHHRQAAINWLTGNSKDFVMVCLFAGMDPDYVRKNAKKALIQPVAWRAAPGKGTRYQERKAYRLRMKRKKPEEESLTRHTSTAEKLVIAGPWK